MEEQGRHIPGETRDQQILDTWINEEVQKLGEEYWKLTSEEITSDDGSNRKKHALEILEDMGFFSLLDEQGSRIYADEELFSYIGDNDVADVSIVDLFKKEARRRVELLMQEDQEVEEEHVVHVVHTLHDVMTLPPGSGSIEKGDGSNSFENKGFHPRKEIFAIVCAELGISYDQYAMPSLRSMSEELRTQVKGTIRGSQGKTEEEVERAMYDLYIVPDQKLSIYISDLGGEGTHVLFVDPLENMREEGRSIDELNREVEQFVRAVASKENMKDLSFLHHSITK